MYVNKPESVTYFTNTSTEACCCFVPSKAGVYILWMKNIPLYVGQSKDMHERVVQHWKSHRDFDGVQIALVSCPMRRNVLEQWLIHKLPMKDQQGSLSSLEKAFVTLRKGMYVKANKKDTYTDDDGEIHWIHNVAIQNIKEQGLKYMVDPW